MRSLELQVDKQIELSSTSVGIYSPTHTSVTSTSIGLDSPTYTSATSPSISYTPDKNEPVNKCKKCCQSRLYFYITFLIIGLALFIFSLKLMNESTTTNWFKWIQGETSQNGIIALIFHTILQPLGFIIIIASMNGILTAVSFIDSTKLLFVNIFFSLIFFVSSMVILFLWNGAIYFRFDINQLPIFPRCLISLWTFFLLITISILCLINVIRIILKHKNYSFDRINSIKLNWSLIFSFSFVLLYLPLCFIYCTLTGHSWHSDPGNYFPRDMVKWVNTESNDKWTFNVLISEYDVSDNSYAIENGLTGKVYMKIFPDLIMYYGWLELICMTALLSYCIPNLRKLLKKRIFLLQTLKFKKYGLADFKFYPTLGDLLFISSLFILLIVWCYYWFGIHLYRQITNIAIREILARSFGMTANLFASLLILPVTRNSSFNNILGVSFEGIIRYHIYCGYIWLLCTVLHVIFFINYWDVHGNDINIDVTKMLPFTMDTPQVYIPNNYNIPQMYYIYLFLIFPIFAILTFPKLRRIKFELFYYFHIAGAWITIAAMFWHAAGFIYFMLPVAGMYFFDRCIRFLNGSQIIKLKDINCCEKDIVKVSVTTGAVKNIVGGYYFMKIANISAFEWHPFSVFKYEKVNEKETDLTFYIRASGDFTKNLYSYVAADDKDNQNLQICLDGPYGCGFNVNNVGKDYQHIFIIAGGIGITPCHSIVDSLIHNENITVPWTLIWIVKNYKELYFCQKAFELIHNNRYKHTFNILLYITQHSDLDKQSFNQLKNDFGSCEINTDRPILTNVIESQLSNDNIIGKQLLYCCGPASLVQSCRKISYFFNMDFKDESFEF